MRVLEVSREGRRLSAAGGNDPDLARGPTLKLKRDAASVRRPAGEIDDLMNRGHGPSGPAAGVVDAYLGGPQRSPESDPLAVGRPIDRSARDSRIDGAHAPDRLDLEDPSVLHPGDP